MNEEQIAKLVQVEDRSLRNEGRIKKLESAHETMQSLATSVAVMAEQLKTMNTSFQMISNKVEKLEAKPGKRWDSIVDKIAWALIAAALGFILAQIGIAG